MLIKIILQTLAWQRKQAVGADRRGQSGQAILLMAIVIFTLFMVFMLLFEVGRLLVAREVILSSARTSGEAALSYLIDYAQKRVDWNVETLQMAAQANQQIWPTFYDTKTGVPQWVTRKAMDYLTLNLQDHLNLVSQDSIKRLDSGKTVIFPYKQANWPTATIGIQMTVTVDVPLFFFQYVGRPTVPITVQVVSIASVDELLGLSSNNSNPTMGDGGSASEFSNAAQIIASSLATPKKWYEPYANFNVFHPIAQWWGCPKEKTDAYNYANGRHAGLDLSIPEGTQLFAVADGVVTSVGFYPFQKKVIGDNAVILKTDDGHFVTYMHMLSFNVTLNQRVKGGDLIGISDGDPKLHPPTFTGFSSGAHLHFQVATGPNYDFPNDIDPESFLGLGADNANAKPFGPQGICD